MADVRWFEVRSATLCAAVVLLLAASARVLASDQSSVALPVGVLSSCQLDLNADEIDDLVLSVQATAGRVVIALLGTKAGRFDAHVLSSGHGPSVVTCRYGAELTIQDKSKPRKITIRPPGAYVEIAEPEGASRAFVWSGGRFVEYFLQD